jgi:hypothetical protein
MPPKPRFSLRLLVGAASVLLVAAGCGAGAAAVVSPSPSVPPVATTSVAPSPTPSAMPTPTRALPTPTVAPSPRFIDTLKIGSPYELVDNPANQSLRGTFTFQIGSVNAIETLSGREIRQRTKLVGVVLVLQFDGIPMNNAAFEGGARGAAATSGGTLTYAKVLGHRVGYIVAKTASFALYLDHDVIIMVAADKLPLVKTLLTAVMKAND